MARISTPDTLEVGSLVGTSPQNMFLRLFEKFDGEAQMRRSFIAHWDGASYQLQRDFDYQIADLAMQGDNKLLVLASDGALFSLSEGAWASIAPPLGERTRVTQLRILQSGIYALGKQMIYQLVDGSWESRDTSLQRAMIFDLAEEPNGQLIVCGQRGALAKLHTDGSVEQLDSQTNVNLISICLRSNRTLVCGQKSTLLELTDDEYSIIPDDAGPRTFYRFCLYQDRLLISATSAILELKSDVLEEAWPRQSFALVQIGDSLFNRTLNTIELFQDGKWVEFPVWLDIPDRGIVGSGAAR